MSDQVERYQILGYKEALTRTHHYPVACKELSLILREAYNKLPKNLQSLVFQDTLSSFKLLPQMWTDNAVSAAHLLVQSAEATLPKQKKNVATKEFKQAMVASKRRGKACRMQECHTELTQDVLVDIFSLLDTRSLVSASLVSRSWNAAACNNHLWQSLYATIFASDHNSSNAKDLLNGRRGEDNKENNSVDWREAFKRAYTDNSSKRLTTSRGYCLYCDMIVWLDGLKCGSGKCGPQPKMQPIVPKSSEQVVEYLLDGSSSMMSSDSDSDLDDCFDEWYIPKLWAHPLNQYRPG
ncbi:F-box protein [Populus alba x Populus x berolinensis]|uniref:F-box protein n=1 Tax=Populus alba x Populus x berolinensis TaxID=444605 RepID=A0AAD6M0W2_9ROSI|nr:F-box protein [Populus alba x Populus x berolinensis]KAJ6976878.1 F-box protein [Populus alba x Populus x berolinensis]